MDIFENLSVSSRLEREALDAYSRAVREVTEKLEPAVISVGLRDGRGGGSGVILGADGEAVTAVTNSHVVRGLRRAGGRRGSSGGIEVTLSGGSSIPAEVLGDDPPSDLAVVRFAPEEEPTIATLGEAGNLVVGQLVIAINTAIIGGAQGIGFAIPVSGTFRRVVFTLVTEGRVRRAYLGVAVVSRPARTRNGFEGGAGVENVAPNSPAERAGVKPQDVIVSFGEEPVRSNDDLLSMLDESAIGRDFDLRVLRGGRELSLKVRPQELPAE